MPRTIQIDVSGFGDPVCAELDDEQTPALASEIWDDLATPMRMWTSHTASTGDWYTSRGRPDPHPHAVGTQAVPLGRPVIMSSLIQGSIVYVGHRSLGFAYGPDITEPLPTTGPVIAAATDLDAFYRAGRHVCDSHFRTHQLITLTISRKNP
jgi:hypothetical protein